MNSGQKVVVMCGSKPFATFQPRPKPQPTRVVIRIVQPQTPHGMKPSVTPPGFPDFLLHLLASGYASKQQTHGTWESHKPTQNLGFIAVGLNSDHGASERPVHKMREENTQDWIAEQFGDALFKSLFEDSDEEGATPPGSRERPMNAEAGPSRVNKPASPSSSTSSFTLGVPPKNLYYSQAMTEDNEPLLDFDKKSGKKRARIGFDPAKSSPSLLLDKLEFALRREIKHFDFPEQVEFLERSTSPGGTPPMPELSHTPNNAGIHAFEKALLGFRENLWLFRDSQDESVIERRLRLEEQIRYKLEDLDKRVLEAWAARRRYSPSLSSRSSSRSE